MLVCALRFRLSGPRQVRSEIRLLGSLVPAPLFLLTLTLSRSFASDLYVSARVAPLVRFFVPSLRKRGLLLRLSVAVASIRLVHTPVLEPILWVSAPVLSVFVRGADRWP